MRLALAVRRELCGMAAALAFLTRLPVPRDLIPEGGELARGAIWFPLAGATVGAVTAGVGAALAGPVAPPVAGVCALATSIVLTGALHLDGLADTADALGARTPDDALLVMRDPRVGAFGVTAIAVLLLAEAGALGALLERERFAAIVTAFALARAVAPLVASRLADARPSGGLAGGLAARGTPRAVAGAALATALVVVLRPHHFGWMLGAAALCTATAVGFSERRFGGVTGDVLGASVAVAEAICLVIASAH
jgi:adenosylcobinamide-GDP ribazoletransferase